ncbi:reverse transcriptase domain-containing protein [Tanacetum coccineum]
MADTRTMSELLQAPIEGYRDAIVIPAILAKNFELKAGLLSLVTSSQFHGFERDDPHSHIRWFNKITSTLKYKNVPHEAIKLMLFPFSLEGAARIWLEKEPPHSIHTWEDLRFDETFSEAWDHFKDLLRKCPHHGFSELHQIDTFYNALTQFDQDSLNAAAGGNLLNRTPRDALTIIENKSKVRISRNKPVVSKASTITSSPSPSLNVISLTEIVKELVLMNKATQQATVKAIEETCVTCGGPHPYYECLATGGNTFDACAANSQNYNQNRYNQNQGNYQAPNNQGFNQQRGQNFNQGNNNYQAPNNQAQVGPSNELSNYMKSNEATLRAMQTQMSIMKSELRNEFKSSFTNQFSSIETKTNKLENQNNQIMNMLTNLTIHRQSPSGLGSLPSNTVANPRGDLKAITTRSGVSYDGPTILPTSSPLPKEAECEPEATKYKVQTTNLGSTAHVQPLVIQVPIPEPDVAPKPNPKPSIPYPSRLNDQKLHEKANNQMLKFLQIFQRLHFDLSFADALLHMPKFTSTFKSLLSNKEKLFELANTPLNENCSAVLLKKLPEKLGDPGKFLIPYDFPELDECLALADLGASINLMPLSVWNKLSLPELTLTRMTLELVNRSVAYPVGVAEDVFVKVGKFHFPADFVVVDYDVDPRIPLILGRPFLRTARALIDVYGEELIVRDGDEQLIFHVDNTSKHPHESINMINFIDITCEDRFFEVLKFKKSNHPSSGSTTPFSNSLLEEFADELTLLNPFPPGNEDDNFDPEAELRKIEYLLNQDLSTESSPKTDTSIAITPVLPTMEPKDSLIMGDEDLCTIPEKESDEFIKSSVEDLVLIPKESEDTSDSDKECDLPFCDNFVTFSKPLFDFNNDFSYSDDESFLEEDVQEENFKIYSNPLFEFDDEYISSDVNPLFNEELEDIESKDSYVSNLDEPALPVTPFSDANEDECFDPGGDINEINAFLDMDVSTDIEVGYHDSEGDEIFLEYLLNKIASMDSSLLSPPGVKILSLTSASPFLVSILLSQWYLIGVELSCASMIAPDYEDSRARGAVLGQSKALPTNDARVVVKFLKSLFARFGTPRAIISDRGTHFCNDQFAKVMLKYGVTHRLSIPYHPQTSGQVEVSNRGLKRILERTVGKNRASWSDKLDDTLWAFHTAFKKFPMGSLLKEAVVTERLVIFLLSLNTRPIGP